jgi:ribonucleoside-diphosphate reductase alpha chain
MEGNKIIKRRRIKKINILKNEDVYDITVKDNHNFFANGILVHNCGEILMGTGVCNLASLNLVKFVNQVDKDKFEFNYDLFKETITTAVRFLDNINDISSVPVDDYLKPLKEKRRIGVGVMGLGSLHFILGIRYGSKESQDLVRSIYKFKAETEILASAELGKEKGSFPLFDYDKYFTQSYWWKNIQISEDVKKKVEDIGCMRNSMRSMNAPTGNTGVFADIVSGGIEPVFMPEYVRWSIVNPDDQKSLRDKGFKFFDIHKNGLIETEHMKYQKRGDETILKGSFDGVDYEIDKSRGLVKATKVVDHGWEFVQENYSQEKIEELKEQGVFATTTELKVEDHLNVLGIISHYIDMNSSKTINLPNNYSYEDFQNVYLQAYKKGIKGVTTYRDGTMTAVLESVEKTEEQMEEYASELEKQFIEANGNIITEDIKLPELSDSTTITVKGEGRKWYFHVCFADRQKTKPFALFIHTNNRENVKSVEKVIEKMEEFALNSNIKKEYVERQIEGYKHQSIVQRVARTISLLLRHNVSINSIIDLLGNPFVGSVLYQIKKVLSQYQTEKTKENVCPVCGSDLHYEESCYKCYNCSWSKCG